MTLPSPAGSDAGTPASSRRRPRSPWTRRVAVGTAVTAVAASFTAWGVTAGAPEAAAAGLRPFTSCDDLAAWQKDVLRPMVTAWGLSWGYGVGVPMVMEDSAVARDAAAPPMPAAGVESAASDASAAVGNGATGTNVQEAGVDEPDVVKTDGSLLVTTVDGRLVVVDVSTGTPSELGSVEVPALQQDGYGATGEVLLVGDRVVVLASSSYQPDAPALPDDGGGTSGSPGDDGGTDDDPDGGLTNGDLPAPAVDIAPVEPGRGIGWGPSVGTATATVVDVSDPSAPVVVTSTELEGSLVSAREADGAVRLVVSSDPVLPFVTSSSTTYDASGQVVDDVALRANLDVLATASGEDLLPHRVLRDSSGAVTGREPAVACDAVSHPGEAAGAGTVEVLTLDVGAVASGGDPVVDAVGVSADGDLVYASTDRLYVATTRGGWMSPDPADDEIRTALHGFDISDASRSTYVASGEVPGYLLGRWALSARDGYLRVATTRGDMWSGGTATDSAVTVLAEGGGVLTPVGEVAGLGVGEQIRAVRWFDDMAVVVTFRQTDPLYVVDLADPAVPVLRGELKVPGYSGYLHPLGDERLLGVGQDATDTGQTLGVQVSSFDLSDPTAPTRVDVLTEADTWSDVESDSRAFSYLPERRVALLPVSDESGYSLRAVAVSADGGLSEVGSWAVPTAEPDSDDVMMSWGYLQRAVPVGGDRVAVLVQGSDADGTATTTVTLLGLDGLSALGAVDL